MLENMQRGQGNSLLVQNQGSEAPGVTQASTVDSLKFWGHLTTLASPLNFLFLGGWGVKITTIP